MSKWVEELVGLYQRYDTAWWEMFHSNSSNLPQWYRHGESELRDSGYRMCFEGFMAWLVATDPNDKEGDK